MSYFKLTYNKSDSSPMIYIEGPLAAPVAEFQSLLREMGSIPESSLNLLHQLFIRSENITSFELHSVSSPASNFPLGIQITKTEPYRIHWRLLPDDWDNMAEFIQPVVDATSPCHQHLTYTLGGPIEVILSKGEW